MMPGDILQKQALDGLNMEIRLLRDENLQLKITNLQQLKEINDLKLMAGRIRELTARLSA